MNLVGQGDPERLEASNVSTADLFPLLGIQPAFGRLFTRPRIAMEPPGTVLLSYGLWQSVFGGDPGVIGRKVLWMTRRMTVIGVMPRDFHFPNRSVEIWTPMQFQDDDFQDRNNNYFSVIARLKRGVSLAQARAEMASSRRNCERQYPKENAQHRRHRQSCCATSCLRVRVCCC